MTLIEKQGRPLDLRIVHQRACLALSVHFIENVVYNICDTIRKHTPCRVRELRYCSFLLVIGLEVLPSSPRVRRRDANFEDGLHLTNEVVVLISRECVVPLKILLTPMLSHLILERFVEPLTGSLLPLDKRARSVLEEEAVLILAELQVALLLQHDKGGAELRSVDAAIAIGVDELKDLAGGLIVLVAESSVRFLALGIAAIGLGLGLHFRLLQG
mmetsp:Transcript_91518/g.230778  ORF Transcript_91518/g.230778 Transcript_91518/m.230778 type:complete len:215 (+) Transcript_91518:1225-1869(+)